MVGVVPTKLGQLVHLRRKLLLLRPLLLWWVLGRWVTHLLLLLAAAKSLFLQLCYLLLDVTIVLLLQGQSFPHSFLELTSQSLYLGSVVVPIVSAYLLNHNFNNALAVLVRNVPATHFRETSSVFRLALSELLWGRLPYGKGHW